MAQYLIRRLPTGGAGDEDVDAPARDLLKKSLGAYLARERNDDAWIESRMEAALAARRADPEAGEALTWADRLAAAAGVPVVIVKNLGDWFDMQSSTQNRTVSDWRDAIWSWFEQRPTLIPSLLRRESLEGLLGSPYKKLQEDETRGRFALPTIRRLLSSWMAGRTLSDLERSFGTQEHKLGKCKAAREFVLHLVPELAYVFGLPRHVVRARATEPDGAQLMALGLETLGSCVREGLDRPEKLALRVARRGQLSRVAVHREFAQLSALIGEAQELEDFPGLVGRVRRAIDLSELPDHDE
jgi:hypothetical protein